ncbi:MAG TPA: hypothetical protein VGY57_14350 [Vicinamibacterales bacterium]|nr:hypothetical protein [Vicinamibacterales bacterium]
MDVRSGLLRIVAMKDYVAAPVLAVLLHGALAFAIRPYQSLIIDVGAMFVHSNDIEDLPILMLAGVSVVGLAWIAAALAAVAALRRGR